VELQAGDRQQTKITAKLAGSKNRERMAQYSGAAECTRLARNRFSLPVQFLLNA
jgi:hypothetical protein